MQSASHVTLAKLLALMSMQGISTIELAARGYGSHAVLDDVFAGRRPLTLPMSARLAEALGATLTEVLTTEPGERVAFPRKKPGISRWIQARRSAED